MLLPTIALARRDLLSMWSAVSAYAITTGEDASRTLQYEPQLNFSGSSPQIPLASFAQSILQNRSEDHARVRHLSRTYMIRDGTPQAAPWDFDVDGLEEPRRCTTCRMPTDWDSPSRRSQVIEVGHEAQLFIDDHLIADWVGLQRVQNSPRVRYLMSEEEAYASQRPGEYLQGRSAKLGDGGTWFMVDGKAFNPPQFRHTPEFPAFVDLSADAKTTTLQMGESRITWTMPSRRAAHTPVAANKVGHDAAYDAYLPELPVTRGWFHEVPVNLFPSVAARMAAGSEGFHPRTSRMNQCTDDSNSPPVVHHRSFYAAYHCRHPDAQNKGWQFPDSLCLASSQNGHTFDAMYGGEPATKLGHGADCEVRIFYQCKARRYVLIKRRNIPTKKYWRHIRGIDVFWTNDIYNASAWERMNSFWLDRYNSGASEDGHDEAYRRQLYGISTTHFATNLEVGVAPVLEYPKMRDVPFEEGINVTQGTGADVLRTYLTHTRDGKHFDTEWIYAGLELVPLSMLRKAAKAAGRKLDDEYRLSYPARNMVLVDGWHHLYLEGRHSRHETRYSQPFELFLASWQYGRFVALTPAADANGELTTRPFLFNGDLVTINLWLRAPDAACHVEVLDGVSEVKLSSRLTFADRADGIELPLHFGDLDFAKKLRSRLVRLRFTLIGGPNDALLFGFQVHSVYSKPPRASPDAKTTTLTVRPSSSTRQQENKVESSRRYTATGMDSMSWHSYIQRVYQATPAESAELPSIDQVGIIYDSGVKLPLALATCASVSVGGPYLSSSTPHVPQVAWFPGRIPFTPLASHSWAEGTHCAGSTFEGNAAWFYVVRGSGLCVIDLLNPMPPLFHSMPYD